MFLCMFLLENIRVKVWVLNFRFWLRFVLLFCSMVLRMLVVVSGVVVVSWLVSVLIVLFSVFGVIMWVMMFSLWVCCVLIVVLVRYSFSVVL